MLETVPLKSSQAAEDSDYNTKDTRYFRHSRPEMLELVPTSCQRILDVGCGKGLFGKLVRDAQPEREVWGIELHRKSAADAQQRLDKVIVGAVPAVLDQIPANYFDCVVFNDILEHLVDPEEALAIAKSKLSSNGCVVASIPNIREFQTLWKLVFNKQWEYTESGILDRTHVRFFTQSSIRNMFARCGYEIESMSGINRTWRRFPRFLNLVTFGLIRDTLYLQFACRARPRREA